MLASLLLCLLAASPRADAQDHRLSPRVIGQVVDEVLRAVVAPDSALSRVKVRERGLYFDYARTLAAFGYRDDSTTRAALALKSVVTPGDASLLVDCNQAGTGPCDRLGQGAYAYVAPRSQSDSELVVQLRVAWPDRGGAPYVRGAVPGGHVFLYGFSMEVHLARASDGSWKFVRIGPTRVSDRPRRESRSRVRAVNARAEDVP